MLEPIEIKPGIYEEASDTSAVGRYKNGVNVRFFKGFPESVGGWIKQLSSQFVGVCRAIYSWTSLDFARYVSLGTHIKLYVSDGATFYDITPVRSSGTYSSDPFDTVSGDATVTINHTSHGAEDGAYVTIAGATSVGGLDLNGEWAVSYVDNDTLTFEHTSTASSTVSGGGASATYEYQINPGMVDTTSGVGFGAGPFGQGTFGTERTISSTKEARVWSLSGWGEDLIACPRGGAIYTWVQDNGVATRAVVISQAPAENLVVLVSPEDRQIISFGSYDTTLGDLDPMLVAWCDSEDYTTWTAETTNNAGTKRLDRGNEIKAAVISRSEIIILTDRTIYSMRRSGDEFIFEFRAEGDTIGAISQKCAVDVDGDVYYMGRGAFVIYDGEARVMNSDVRGYVFDDLNWSQAAKVYGARNKLKDEIIWFYPSAGSDEIDKCVGYNYVENTWWTGNIARTSWIDENALIEEPLATSADGYLYVQEYGATADGSQLEYSIETYDFQLPGRLADGYGTGEFVRKLMYIVPDFDSISGNHDVTITGRKYPQGEVLTRGPVRVTSTTDKLDAHLRARQFSIKLESAASGASMRMGIWRAEMRNQGKR